MLCEYLHKKSVSLAQCHTTMTEIQHFYRGLYFIGAPCRLPVMHNGAESEESVGAAEEESTKHQQRDIGHRRLCRENHRHAVTDSDGRRRERRTPAKQLRRDNDVSSLYTTRQAISHIRALYVRRASSIVQTSTSSQASSRFRAA